MRKLRRDFDLARLKDLEKIKGCEQAKSCRIYRQSSLQLNISLAPNFENRTGYQLPTQRLTGSWFKRISSWQVFKEKRSLREFWFSEIQLSTARYVQNVIIGRTWQKPPIGSWNMLNIQFYYRYLSFQNRTISVKSLVSDFNGDDEKRWFTRGV